VKDRIANMVFVVLVMLVAVEWKRAQLSARYHYQGRYQAGGRSTRRADRRLHEERHSTEVKAHQFAELIRPVDPRWDDTGFTRPPLRDPRFRALSRSRLTEDAFKKVKELSPWRARGQ
jgi:hypothetical protein